MFVESTISIGRYARYQKTAIVVFENISVHINLPPEAWQTWLNPALPGAALEPLLRPWPGAITAWPVTTALNRAAYTGPVTPVTPPPRQAELF